MNTAKPDLDFLAAAEALTLLKTGMFASLLVFL